MHKDGYIATGSLTTSSFSLLFTMANWVEKCSQIDGMLPFKHWLNFFSIRSERQPNQKIKILWTYGKKQMILGLVFSLIHWLLFELKPGSQIRLA